MIEPSQWLRTHAEQLGVKQENINSASVDLELGGEVIEVRPNGQRITYHLAPGEEFIFEPGSLYIAHSEEYTRCPTSHAWMLNLKSSTGRKGLNHLHAGWGDPGFEGQVTYELVAHVPVTFRRGQRIVQLVYMRLTEPTAEPYGGQSSHYQGQIGATEARQ